MDTFEAIIRASERFDALLARHPTPFPFCPAMTPTSAPVVDALARGQAASMDEKLRIAITNQIGTWTLGDLKGRLARVIEPESDLETYTLDGVPIMQMGPVSVESFRDGDRIVMKASRGYRILNEKNESP